MTALLMAIAASVDWLLGEPRRWHPLVGFGRIATRVERALYGAEITSPWVQRLRGVLALSTLLIPATALGWLASQSRVGAVFDVAMLYFALGHRSLHDHARPIAAALNANDHTEAQQLASRIVSRDSAAIDPAPAAVESVLENGNDGVFGALFWFALFGGAGAVLYRLANTLDAMWGYKTSRYLYFGWAAARFDDVLNWPAARLCALTYALLGRTTLALRCWRTQAPAWDSPNAGPVMAAGAGALGLRIGGPARYHGEWHERPALGVGDPPCTADIERALRLVRRGVLLWIVFLACASLLFWGISHA